MQMKGDSSGTDIALFCHCSGGRVRVSFFTRWFLVSLLLVVMGYGVHLYRLHGEIPRVSAVVSDDEAAGLYEKAGLFSQASQPTHTLENYWKDSKLDIKILENQIQDRLCYKDEKSFLSCINALMSIAHQLNLNITEKGYETLPSGFLEKTEMQMLRPWSQKYEEFAKSKKMKFLELWNQLKVKIPEEKLPLMIATGLNGFYSIKIDPHSYLLPLNYYQNVLAKADHQSQSLGIILTKKNGLIYIRKVLNGSIAEQNGLRRGDQIKEINGVKITVDQKNRINDLLRPVENRPTRIILVRSKKMIKVTLFRESTEVKTVATRHYPAQKSAMVTLNKFAKKSCQLLEQELQRLEKSGVKSLVLDLRDNAGGQIDEAACMVGLFVGPKKKVFELRYFDKTVSKEVYASRKQKSFTGTLAVLVNSGSASSSEILAGALQDFGRAVLVGETTFGKGTFQEGEVWEKNSRIVFFQTKGLFYLPSGRTPQAHGIVPDVEIASVGETRRERDLYYNYYEVQQPEVPMPRIAALTTCKDQIIKVTNEDLKKQLKPDEVFDLEMQTAQNTLSCLTQRVSSLETRTN